MTRRLRRGGAFALLPAAALAAACGGAAPDPGSVPRISVPAPEPPAAGGGAAALAAQPAGTDWLVSRTARALDGRASVVVYRAAGETGGIAPDADIVLYVRCIGDRTQVEFAYPVPLGDDVYDDGEQRTKRVVLRLLPAAPTAAVWPVGPDGRSLLVAQPVRFLRQLVLSDMLVVQTTSVGGAVLFAAYELSPVTFERLDLVAAACDWQLDTYLAAVEFETEAQALLREQRAAVLETYVATPLLEGLERWGVDDGGDLYLNMPAPVGRAYLGYGLTVSRVEDAARRGFGIVCLHGEWIGDEIMLAECYPEDEAGVLRQLAPQLLDGGDSAPGGR